jgi:hypothetical protein
MIRILGVLLLLAACTPAPTALPDDFDASFAF